MVKYTCSAFFIESLCLTRVHFCRAPGDVGVIPRAGLVGLVVEPEGRKTGFAALAALGLVVFCS